MLATIPAPVLELFPRVHALVRAGSTDYAESTMAIPVANYRDPATATRPFSRTSSSMSLEPARSQLFRARPSRRRVTT
jgi:hypothetical protein